MMVRFLLQTIHHPMDLFSIYNYGGEEYLTLNPVMSYRGHTINTVNNKKIVKILWPTVGSFFLLLIHT